MIILLKKQMIGGGLMKANIIVLLLLCNFGISAQIQSNVLPVPTENQLRWQEMEMYAFIHYSLNTYTDQEWGFGNEDPKLFNPSDLDCRQWARVCKQAGMKGIIFTAKHHCGFCMWPSAFTEYSVKNSPWKNGQGDVVKELADACREEGLKFAVYLSPWDRNHKDYGKPEYVTYFRNQLRELLTNYGEIFEVWFDGANGGDGWYGGANETRRIDGKTYYQWAETFRMIRELQPKAVIWNDGGDRGDLRWVGTEAGNVGETNWSLMPGKGDTPWHMLHFGVEDGDVWCPGETNTSIRPGWFYHEAENEHVKSLSKLMDTYYKSVGRNSCLLLNFPIAPNGRIHPTDSLRGIAFKKMIDEVFKTDLAAKADIKSQRNETIINFKHPTAFNRFVAEEDIRYGQRVKKFSIEAEVDGKWVPLKDELVERLRVGEQSSGMNGDGLTTIGHRRIICFPTVTATKLRFTVTDSKSTPIIKRTSVYLAPELTADITDSGEKRSSSLHYFFSSPKQMLIDWDTEQTITSFRYLPPQEKKNGMITHYTLSASTDWANWTKLASGEFSNIVNNPIWQTIKFQPVKAKILKLDADRLAEGERMAFADIEVVTTPAESPAEKKPRLVVLTDIAPGNIEPDDMESMVRLMAYADQVEIEGLITTIGWNCDPYPKEWADSLWRVIDAYEHDLPNLMKRSRQTTFRSMEEESGSQTIGYWPSAAYLRSRVAMGSTRAGIGVIGAGNRSAGSDLIIRLVDEADERPLWIASWGGANTLAQAIWQVQQERTPEQVKAFLNKLRVYTITDQDMVYAMRMNRAYSSHQWMRRDFADDLLFIWDESAWLTQCELGSKNWQQYAQMIQGKGQLGQAYPTYKWGVEGDTPSWLYILPNGLHDPNDPRQIGWAGCFRRDMCPDSLTTSWTNWRQPQKDISRQYEERFYPDIFNDFAARMVWADTGHGNTNPVVIVNGDDSRLPVRLTATNGQTINLDASASYDLDGDDLSFQWWIQSDIGNCPQDIKLTEEGAHATLSIPELADDVDIHLVCEVRDNGAIPLTSYRRVIIKK
ncbi:MAG: DUF1593 domain-containing protein [Prevotella sp.]|nr:DUF1593 domain-containing protein [Prevotella sp.]